MWYARLAFILFQFLTAHYYSMRILLIFTQAWRFDFASVLLLPINNFTEAAILTPTFNGFPLCVCWHCCYLLNRSFGSRENNFCHKCFLPYWPFQFPLIFSLRVIKFTKLVLKFYIICPKARRNKKEIGGRPVIVGEVSRR